jgi:competence protein ComEA
VLGVALLLSVTACVKRENNQRLVARQADEMQSASALASAPGQRQTRVNINSASANELETLPGIGHGLAERIIEHRQKYGPFRRPEHLLIVRGISDKRFRALEELITVE